MSALVYVLSNEAMPRMLKIGHTTNDVGKRMGELYSTGVPLPFKCVKSLKLRTAAQARELEAALHLTFSKDRVNDKREFFRINEEQATAILDYLNKDKGGQDATEETNVEIAKTTDSIDKAAVEKARKRRPNLDFVAVGIRAGAELVFVNDNSVTCKVVDPLSKMVDYLGNVVPLRIATNLALGRDRVQSIRPASYWIWDGSKLDEWYELTQD